jgi:hypothetical protein
MIKRTLYFGNPAYLRQSNTFKVSKNLEGVAVAAFNSIK